MSDTAGARATAEDTALADGHRLARGAAANALVLLAANFRGVFTFLIARVLGEAALGRFGLVWATTDLLSKAGMLGLDSGVVPTLVTRVAVGDGEGARRLFRRGLALAAVASLVPRVQRTGVGNGNIRRGIDAGAGHAPGRSSGDLSELRLHWRFRLQ